MPFNIDGPASSEPSSHTLRVDPDKVLQLKADLQPIRDEVFDFLNNRTPDLMVRPLGADPVSRDAADTFNQNAQAAIDTATAYLDRMNNLINGLDQTAKAYNLVEDTTTQTFQQGNQ